MSLSLVFSRWRFEIVVLWWNEFVVLWRYKMLFYGSFKMVFRLKVTARLRTNCDLYISYLYLSIGFIVINDRSSS